MIKSTKSTKYFEKVKAEKDLMQAALRFAQVYRMTITDWAGVNAPIATNFLAAVDKINELQAEAFDKALAETKDHCQVYKPKRKTKQH